MPPKNPPNVILHNIKETKQKKEKRKRNRKFFLELAGSHQHRNATRCSVTSLFHDCSDRRFCFGRMSWVSSVIRLRKTAGNLPFVKRSRAVVSLPPPVIFFFFLLVFSFYIFFCIKNVHLALKNLVGLKKNFFSFDFPVGLWWTHSDRSVAEKDIQWLLCGIVSTVEDIRSAGYTLTSSPFSPSLRPVQVSFYGGSCAVKKYSTRDCFTHTHTYTHRKRVKFDWFDWFVHILEKEEKKTFVSLSYVHLLVMLTDTAFLDDAQ